MRILGIDPGLATMGYGVIDAASGKLKLVSAGAIITKPDQKTPDRLRVIRRDIHDLLMAFKPDEIVFEEFIATGCYLPMEINLFESIISTVARRRKIKVFMIGNTISRNCIYFQHFSLLNVPKQEQGTIDIYEMPTDPPQYNEDGTQVVIKIAVELCENKTANTKMFAGNSQKAISNGAWTSEVQPKIKFKDSFDEIYRIVFKFRMSMFLARFYVDNENGDMFWVVEPKVKPIKDGTRVISDVISASSLYTSNLNPLCPQEKIMFDYIKKDKVFYSDNLTGTEFKEAVRYFINNKIGYK